MNKSRVKVRLLPSGHLNAVVHAAVGMAYEELMTLIERAYWKAWDRDDVCVSVIINGQCLMIPWEAFEVSEVKE